MDHSEIDILIVDDSTHDSMLTLRALNETEQVIHVKNGALALDFLYGKGEYKERNINKIPKLILLDLKMPKVSGLELLEKIKQNEQTRNIPVVVFTSSNEVNDIKRSYLLGANSYIVKPLDFEVFRKLVKEVQTYWLTLNETLK